MKMKYLAAVSLLLIFQYASAGIRINFDMIVGVRMGPADSSVEGAAVFRADREFIIETEFPDGVVRESGTYSYDPDRGELVLKFRGPRGAIRYSVLSTNGRVKLMMQNRVAEAPPFILELIYGVK